MFQSIPLFPILNNSSVINTAVLPMPHPPVYHSGYGLLRRMPLLVILQLLGILCNIKVPEKANYLTGK